jgi:type I restriction enzyme R subunit
MSLHHEIAFEREICEHLGANGWLYEEGSAAAYSRELALYPPDLIAWVQEAQPEAWEVLQKNHGAKAETTLLQRVRQQLDQVGSLDLLRHGVEVLGLPKALKLAEFKSAFGLNPQVLARYNANRLRVVRQVHYSTRNENCLDLVLFLNGIPVATAELKTDNTQSIADAVWQYKTDRLPRAAGQTPEPLLSFPSGALVHFAVSNREVQMTTRLEGPRTQFLPFNQGSDPGGPDCGAGNPVMAGHRTAYLWEEVWERHSWLEIIGRYCIAERDKKKQIRRLVFPRYHQLAAMQQLLLSKQPLIQLINSREVLPDRRDHLLLEQRDLLRHRAARSSCGAAAARGFAAGSPPSSAAWTRAAGMDLLRAGRTGSVQQPRCW